jgi:hypothetical protein
MFIRCIFIVLVLTVEAPYAFAQYVQLDPQSIDTNRCQHLVGLYQQYDDQHQYQKAYDTSREYINECAELSVAWGAFQSIDAFNATRSDDLHRFEEYREWLKKVLYYNTDTLYYCADVVSILGTFSWFNDERGRDWKGMLAVDSFIRKSGKCPDLNAFLDTAFIPGHWHGAHQAWLDSVDDPAKSPFDSTLPSLEDLGLSILRGNPSKVADYPHQHPDLIGSLVATVNPFTNETSLRFDIKEGVFLKLEIFDPLGKLYYHDAKFFSEGIGDWKLVGRDLPSGTLYARLTTLSGEVKTIKLIKE